MQSVKKKYITDRRNRRIAVRISIRDFERMEGVIENYGLYQLMQQENDRPLTLAEAKSFYQKLKKAK
ncbi:MAG: hypothetical protein K1X63_11685 [Chitinophagales bacterium]|nr:hypothetical protein [Bacteroidota bacterium]MBX7141728.1 hypothetical protein [Chitinophagales bacterium]